MKTQYQDPFLSHLFVEIFGYTMTHRTLNTAIDLKREYKNQTDAKRADGAILKEGRTVAVIELKDTKTKRFE